MMPASVSAELKAFFMSKGNLCSIRRTAWRRVFGRPCRILSETLLARMAVLWTAFCLSESWQHHPNSRQDKSKESSLWSIWSLCWNFAVFFLWRETPNLTRRRRWSDLAWNLGQRRHQWWVTLRCARKKKEKKRNRWKAAVHAAQGTHFRFYASAQFGQYGSNINHGSDRSNYAKRGNPHLDEAAASIK